MRFFAEVLHSSRRTGAAVVDGENLGFESLMVTIILAGDNPCTFKSSHGVFQLVDGIVGAAVMHFNATFRTVDSGNGSPLDPVHDGSAAALVAFLVWLTHYQSLFSARCALTGKLLLPDGKHGCLVPPVFREYRTSSPHTIYGNAYSASALYYLAGKGA
eukprot:m.665762 g.665762  ORF g.665762 m.665762 type:complete len:159 (-) comp22748_c0_seq13:105-581(-)